MLTVVYGALGDPPPLRPGIWRVAMCWPAGFMALASGKNYEIIRANSCRIRDQMEHKWQDAGCHDGFLKTTPAENRGGGDIRAIWMDGFIFFYAQWAKCVYIFGEIKEDEERNIIIIKNCKPKTSVSFQFYYQQTVSRFSRLGNYITSTFLDFLTSSSTKQALITNSMTLMRTWTLRWICYIQTQ